ncbi:MAG TPA: YcxB family protein [Roseiflexaceae bacterium]|nr:YcxB family protein [Roseiflexaceae bacterium]
MNTITIDYQPELREQLDAARLYQRSTRKHRVYRVFAVLALGAGIWMLATGGPALLIGIWTALAAFMWFDPVPIMMIRLSYNRKALARRYHVTFSPEGIRFDIGGQVVQRGWERYRRILENQNLYVLVYGNWMYSVIPKRAFADDQQRAQFHALLTESTGTRPATGASYL